MTTLTFTPPLNARVKTQTPIFEVPLDWLSEPASQLRSDGTFVVANKRWSETWGTVAGLRWHEFAADFQVNGAPSATPAGLAINGCDIRFRTLIRGQRWFRICASETADGRCLVVMVDVDDITSARLVMSEALADERKARDTIERASRQKDDFLAEMSHELRTPLNTLLAWTEVLERRIKGSGELQRAVSIIKVNVRAQATLIDQLTNIEAAVAGKIVLDRRSVDLSSLIEELVTSFELAFKLKNIQLCATVDSNLPLIDADRGRLTQVLSNVIGNALKFTECGGKVELRAREENSNIEVEVADSGIGISPELLPDVFQRFRQRDHGQVRKFGGLGLGLTIAKQLVELHGGSICADSPGDGLGTVLRIRIPCVQTFSSFH